MILSLASLWKDTIPLSQPTPAAITLSDFLPQPYLVFYLQPHIISPLAVVQPVLLRSCPSIFAHGVLGDPFFLFLGLFFIAFFPQEGSDKVKPHNVLHFVNLFLFHLGKLALLLENLLMPLGAISLQSNKVLPSCAVS